MTRDLERTPEGRINNCAVANGAPESECQVCPGRCPDKPAVKLTSTDLQKMLQRAQEQDEEQTWREDHEFVSRSPDPARVCLRCKHSECPHCDDYCDASVPEPTGDERDMCPCLESPEGRCVYDSPRSAANEAWIEEFCVVGLIGSEDDDGHLTAWRVRTPTYDEAVELLRARGVDVERFLSRTQGRIRNVIAGLRPAEKAILRKRFGEDPSILRKLGLGESDDEV